jgi:hypothetical protein
MRRAVYLVHCPHRIAAANSFPLHAFPMKVQILSFLAGQGNILQFGYYR